MVHEWIQDDPMTVIQRDQCRTELGQVRRSSRTRRGKMVSVRCSIAQHTQNRPSVASDCSRDTWERKGFQRYAEVGAVHGYASQSFANHVYPHVRSIASMGMELLHPKGNCSGKRVRCLGNIDINNSKSVRIPSKRRPHAPAHKKPRAFETMDDDSLASTVLTGPAFEEFLRSEIAAPRLVNHKGCSMDARASIYGVLYARL